MPMIIKMIVAFSFPPCALTSVGQVIKSARSHLSLCLMISCDNAIWKARLAQPPYAKRVERCTIHNWNCVCVRNSITLSQCMRPSESKVAYAKNSYDDIHSNNVLNHTHFTPKQSYACIFADEINFSDYTVQLLTLFFGLLLLLLDSSCFPSLSVSYFIAKQFSADCCL